VKIVIVDYGIGNVQSIFNALSQFKDIDVFLSDSRNEILNADGLILPGVGAFKKAMEELNLRNLPSILKEYISLKKPFLGICLGMQLLFESSEEFGYTKGLGFVKGSVEGFPESLSEKLPHVSWNSIEMQELNWGDSIFEGIKNKEDVYFVHSYICKPNNQDIILSKTEYGGINFCSSIQQGSIYACQFHPEKSAGSGLNIIKNFLNIVEKNK
jgi:imidazole glycerol-phosphate synthase subunit HisH